MIEQIQTTGTVELVKVEAQGAVPDGDWSGWLGFRERNVRGVSLFTGNRVRLSQKEYGPVEDYKI